MNNLDNLHNVSFASPTSAHDESPSPVKQIFRWIGRVIAGCIVISLFSVLLLRWIDPPTTSFMLQRQFTAWWMEEENFELRYQWTDWENISPQIKMAAIASEDQSFASHWGLDLESIQKAINEYEQGQDLRGASTITQQVAKNLFLWGSQSYIRKGIEAYFAILIDFLWPKQRILEVYLNIVEFGNGVYGVQPAAKQYFNTSADKLVKWQSALMVTALPAPKRYNLANPSEYMLDRSSWVMRYMDLLGNSTYLQKLK